MALDTKTFRTRAITAIVFAAVMLLGLFTSFSTFFILFSIIHVGCWWEYLRLVEKIHNAFIAKIVKIFIIICGFTAVWILGFRHSQTDIYFNLGAFRLSFKLVFWALQLTALYVLVLKNQDISSKAGGMIFLGFLYISLPITLVIHMRGMFSVPFGNNIVDIGILLPCAIIFSIWINDTMAYLVGSMIGKTPLSKISPKKTWEGTGGGAILCVVVIAILGSVIPAAKAVPVYHWIAIATICAIFGTMGDLLESKIKRLAGVKDSGSFMPGHGGFLDRFDSFLLATPFVWLYVQLFMVGS